MNKKRVLVVEDEQIIQVLCRRLLGQLGVDLTVVGSVQEGAAIIEKDPPDLLVTDLRLPDGDGVEGIMLLKAKSPASKVIVITGSPTPEDRLRRIEDFGIVEYINKPFEVDMFLKAIERALNE